MQISHAIVEMCNPKKPFLAGRRSEMNLASLVGYSKELLHLFVTSRKKTEEVEERGGDGKI